MLHRHTDNPLYRLLIMVSLMVLLAIVADPRLRPWGERINAQRVQADFSEDATAVLGPDNYTNAADWNSFYSTDSTSVNVMVYDEEGETLYAAGDNFGNGPAVVRLCFNESSATPCADSSNWTTSFSAEIPYEMTSLVLDTEGGVRVLYAGSQNNYVFRCDIDATGCDGDADWENVLDTGWNVNSLALNSDIIIAASNTESSTQVHVCELSSGCNSGDWDGVSMDTYDSIDAMIWDGATHFYAGHDGGILRCEASSLCDINAEWEDIADLPFTNNVNEMTLDADNGVLYAGTADQIARCILTSDCGVGANWETVYTNSNSISALVWDAISDSIYAGVENSGTVFKCEITANGCDSDGDWQRVTNDASVYVTAFARDAATQTLYAAGGATDTYFCDLAEGCNDVSEIGFITNGASGLAYDSSGGRLFVSDDDAGRVLVYDIGTLTDGEYPVSVVGQADRNDELGCNRGNGEGVLDEFSLCRPHGLAYDSTNGRLFVADTYNNRVLVYDASDGIDEDEAAVNVIGQTDFTSTDFDVDQNHLNQPRGVAYDSTTDRLFVTDYSHGRVMVFDVDPAVFISGVTNGPLAVNEIGQGDGDESSSYYDTSGASIGQATMESPWGVAVDEAGQRLFLSDETGHRITVYNINTSVLVPDNNPNNSTNGPDAINLLGQIPYESNPDAYQNNSDCFDEPFTAIAANCFSSPHGISYDPADERLLVADTGNTRILAFDVAIGTLVDGAAAVEVWGQPDFATGDANLTQSGLANPVAVAHGSGLFVADQDNDRVLAFGISVATPTPTATPGGGGGPGITPIGFYPEKITVNNDDPEVGDKNVLVNVFASFSESFEGTVDVLLSNRPDFAAFVPFRYNIPDSKARAQWPKTVAWDLCLGLPQGQTCEPGTKTVYARFYVNVAPPIPQFITNNP